MKNHEPAHTGSSFADFLDEEGMRNEVESAAIKRVLAWQFEQAMLDQRITKQGMAKELQTSRSQLDRLLDPANTSVSLQTLTRAANVLGKRLVFEIRDHPPARKTRRSPVERSAVKPAKSVASRLKVQAAR